jgi:hypothetical protein
MMSAWIRAAGLMTLGLVLGCSTSQSQAKDARDEASGQALLASKYESIKPALARSPFQRPLLLESGASPSEPHGDVYAVVAHPFVSLATALQRADHWCEMLILPFNIKRCLPTGQAPQQVLQVAVGRKNDQPVDEAHQLDFAYAVRAADKGYLAVQMAAPAGPLGTSDYRLTLEAIPLDAQHSFVHMSYAYASGLAARLATSTYLATTGRDKVGFSIVGRDESGKPVYVDGVQGVAERNTMRYFLAIEAFLKTLGLPEERKLEQRLREWFAATERYPRQLREMPLGDYLAMKRRELQRQTAASS